MTENIFCFQAPWKHSLNSYLKLRKASANSKNINNVFIIKDAIKLETGTKPGKKSLASINFIFIEYHSFLNAFGLIWNSKGNFKTFRMVG